MSYNQYNNTNISIHALLAESDLAGVNSMLTLIHFYPRSPCGERHARRALGFVDPDISIHALLAESDNRFGRPIDVQLVFLSTLSLRRATGIVNSNCNFTQFLSTLSLRRATVFRAVNSSLVIFLSTLSLRRATAVITACPPLPSYFYPRSPCGERPQNLGVSIIQLIFLSTLSLRRATRHQLRYPYQGRHFYPRSPCGERP